MTREEGNRTLDFNRLGVNDGLQGSDSFGGQTTQPLLLNLVADDGSGMKLEVDNVRLVNGGSDRFYDLAGVPYNSQAERFGGSYTLDISKNLKPSFIAA